MTIRKQISTLLFMCIIIYFPFAYAFALNIFKKFPGAKYALKIEEEEQQPANAPVGSVYIFPFLRNLPVVEKNIAVCNAEGKRVKSKLIWTSSGSHALIAFQTCGDSVYYVLCGKSIGKTRSSWKPKAGIILETRKYIGGDISSYNQVCRLWRNSPLIFGRGFVSRVFSGTNYFGETKNYISLYKGYFNVVKKGKYHFAVVSDNASFLKIDGRLIVQWPGEHYVWKGRRGEYNGSIFLSQGVHSFSYLNVQTDKGFRVVMAWKPPGAKHFSVMWKNIFVPVTKFRVKEIISKLKRSKYFQWNIKEHTVFKNFTFVNVEFYVIPFSVSPSQKHEKVVYRWVFDDGTLQSGRRVKHVFISTGYHKVALLSVSRNRIISKNVKRILIHKNWPQINECPQDALAFQKKSLATRDYTKTKIEDIETVLSFAFTFNDYAIIENAGAEYLGRCGNKAFSSPSAELLMKLAKAFMSYRIKDYRLAEFAFGRAVSVQGLSSTIGRNIKILYADFLLHIKGNIKEAEKYLAEVAHGVIANIKPNLPDSSEYYAYLNSSSVPLQEKKLFVFCLADIYVLKDKVENAKNLCMFFVRNRTNSWYDYLRAKMSLFSAEKLIAKKKYDEAYKLILRAEGLFPPIHIQTKTLLLKAEVNFHRHEYKVAVSHCKEALNTDMSEVYKPHTLLLLIKSNLALHNDSAVEKFYNTLLKEFPLTASAAKARFFLRGKIGLE